VVATESASTNAVIGRDTAVPHGGFRGASSAGDLRAVERLLDRADAMELRAPELSVVLAERAASLAESAGANSLWVRAEATVVHARVRLGHRASTVGRAVTALRAAEDAGLPVVAARVRTDLAVCARSVGAPLTGLAILRPVLTVGGLSTAQRATALCHLVGCLGTLGRKAELDRVLLEGDRLVAADSSLGDDERLVTRALIRLAVSGHRRRHGDVMGAADAARTGIGLLDKMTDPATDGGLARIRLVLELVCSLLDRGDGELALEAAQPLLDQPERAASVAPAAWLRTALATRVLLRNGSAESAATMLRDALYSVGRHDLDALSARMWLELANVEEHIGNPSEAVTCLHNARAAEQRYARARSQARAVLHGEFGSGEQAPVDLAEIVTSARPASTSAARQDMPAQSTAASDAPSAQPAAEAPSTATAANGHAVSAGQPAAGGRSGDQPAVNGHGESSRGSAPPESAAEATAVMPAIPAFDSTASNAHADTERSADGVEHTNGFDVTKTAATSTPATKTPVNGHHAVPEPDSTPNTEVPEAAAAPEPTADPAAANTAASNTGASNTAVSNTGASNTVEASTAGPNTAPLTPAPQTPAPQVPGMETPAAGTAAAESGGAAAAAESTQAVEPTQAAEPTHEAPTSAAAANGTEPERDRQASSEPRRRRRHDSEHGSVTARSVLDRLGISPSGGGRRRATADTEGARSTSGETHGSGRDADSNEPSLTDSTRAEVLDSGTAGASVEPILAAATASTPEPTPESTPESTSEPTPEPTPESTAILPAITDDGPTAGRDDRGTSSIDSALDGGAPGRTDTAARPDTDASTDTDANRETASGDASDGNQIGAQDGTQPDTEPDTQGGSQNDTWLPRLKLPPPLLPLAPFADDTAFTDDTAPSDGIGEGTHARTHDGTAAGSDTAAQPETSDAVTPGGTGGASPDAPGGTDTFGQPAPGTEPARYQPGSDEPVTVHGRDLPSRELPTYDFASEPAYELPAEEPPEDAGLAELLARALAEHHAASGASALAGTASGDERSPHSGVGGMNGSRRNGSANGRGFGGSHNDR